MPAADPARIVVRFPDVCQELGLSPTTLRRICRAGPVPPLLRRSERRSGVRRGDLDAWVEGLKKGCPEI